MYEKELQWLLREKYHGKESDAYLRDKARVLAGEPIDYIIGWKDFLGSRILLQHHPLIPRVETEYWVDRLISTITPIPPSRILDLFSGSGAIGVALARSFPKASLVCADINTSALEQIKENLAHNSVTAEVVRSDVFEQISGTFDLIVANPPYIPHGSKDLHQNVKRYEPHDALFAKEEGMEFIRQLLEDGKRYLSPRGILAIEYDDPQKSFVEALGKEHGWDMEFLKDQFGLWRAVLCMPMK